MREEGVGKFEGEGKGLFWGLEIWIWREKQRIGQREREGEKLGFGILEGWGFAGVFTPYNGFPNYGR